MLAKLSIANVRRSYKDFAIYFFTLLIGVAVFYAFNSITAQDAVLAFDKSQGNMIELLGILIDGVSVFICVILAFLVVYASRYLIKRRNKEFAFRNAKKCFVALNACGNFNSRTGIDGVRSCSWPIDFSGTSLYHGIHVRS